MERPSDRKAKPPTVMRALLPFYVPVLTVTLVLALLFAVGVREQDRLRQDHIERVLAALAQSERHVADEMRERLLQTERSLLRYQDSLQRAMQELDPPRIAALAIRFAEQVEPLPDGTHRSRRARFDARREAGIWLPRGTAPTPLLAARLMQAKQVTDTFGRGAQDNLFSDTWWLPAGGGIVFFGPTPDLAGFVYQAEADYSYADTDWMRLTQPSTNPQRDLRWTPLAFDPTPRVWMFSAVLPLYHGDEWLGSIGHDVPLQDLLRRVEALGQVEGSLFVLLTADDRVVASDRYADAIVAAKGALHVRDLDQPLLRRAVADLRARFPGGRGGEYRLLDEEHVALVSHIAAQDLVLANLVPLRPIAGPVQSAFNRLRDLAIFALLLELIVACGVLWWNHRQTRLGFAALTAAHDSLAEREARLAELNDQLEQRVEARTAELNASRLRAEQALEALQNTQRQLLESEKMASLGQLVAGVAHEINTPIGVAVTAASHLESSGKNLALKFTEGRVSSHELDAWRHEVVEGTGLILGSLGRACALIGSFKQVAVDQSSEQRRRVDLRACLEEIAVALGPTLRRGDHKLSLSCPEGVEVDTYPGALFQILGNCVNNSVLHGFPDGRQGEIVVRVREVGASEFELVYADDGIGMLAEVAARAFEPFFTTRRGNGGTGLGLHIVYSLATRLLGGSVELRSAPGEGMTLRLRLPRVAPRRQESPVQMLRTVR